MYRRANRASFLRRAGSSCLCDSYGKLVALEILLKDHLGAAATAGASHDVPQLLGMLSAQGSSATPPIPATTLNSKTQQLRNKLHGLTCAAKNGSRTPVPPANYPFMRYVFHERDGSNPSDVKEQDLVELGRAVDDILLHLATAYKVIA